MTLNIFPEHNKKEKKVQIELDEYTEYASKYFDYEFDRVSVFEAWGKPNVPKKFSIGLIVGPSGSGKSTLLDDFGKEENIEWQNKKAIVFHSLGFGDIYKYSSGVFLLSQKYNE